MEIDRESHKYDNINIIKITEILDKIPTKEHIPQKSQDEFK